MNKLGQLPAALEVPTNLRDALPSLRTLVRDEPRGGPADREVAIAKASLDVPAIPGAHEANQREAYRQRLVAANRALDGAQFNTTASGAITGLFVAAGLVLGGVEGAAAVGLAVGAWKVIKLLGGRS